MNALQVLNLCTGQFSWHCQGNASSHFDYVYLPSLLNSSPRVVQYNATTLDYHAFLLQLEMAGLVANPGLAVTASSSFYWKLNSAVLTALHSYHALVGVGN